MILTDSEVGSLKAALNCWEWFGYISTAIVFVGCMGEFVAEFTSLPKSEKVEKKLARLSLIVLILGIAGELLGTVRTSQLSGQIIANIEERAGNAERRAGEANNEAAQLRMDAETLKRANLLLQANILELQQKAAWRMLSEKQKQVLCSVLTPRIANVVGVKSASPDPEAWRYATDFGDELGACALSGGFPPQGHLGNMTAWGPNVVYGVWFSISKNPNWEIGPKERQRIAISLRNKLRANGVKIEGISKEDASSLIDIYVGPRFPPHAITAPTNKNP